MKSNSNRTNRRNVRRLRFEQLEDKKLLAIMAYTTGDASPTAAHTLRDAINEANSTAGIDTIEVSGALLAAGLTLQQGPLEIKEPVIIQGNGLTISSGGTIFNVNSTGGPVGEVSIIGFKMSSSIGNVDISSLLDAQSRRTFSGMSLMVGRTAFEVLTDCFRNFT